MTEGNKFGKIAETIAAEFLITQGYTVRERNWRCGHLEIDIIAQKENIIVFVEVKARNGKYSDPLDAVDNKKIKRITNAANGYISSLQYDFDCRFDIIAITGNEKDYSLEHIEDAFIPPLRSY